MSCYMVERSHIVYLIRAAVAGNIAQDRRFNWLRSKGGPGEPCTWAELRQYDEPADLAAVATMLWKANLASVNARYPDAVSGGMVPGFVDDDSAGYVVAPVYFRGPDLDHVDPVQVLKSAACYEYQANEVAEWEESEAHHFILALQNAAIAALPGYGAAVWGSPELPKEGTYERPMRYERITATDPERKLKLKAQRAQMEADAKAGKVLCITDIMSNYGM